LSAFLGKSLTVGVWVAVGVVIVPDADFTEFLVGVGAYKFNYLSLFYIYSF
jgi:hypothetical protein